MLKLQPAVMMQCKHPAFVHKLQGGGVEVVPAGSERAEGTHSWEIQEQKKPAHKTR